MTRKHGKYRDSKHYRQYKGKQTKKVKVTNEATPKYTASSSSWSQYYRCTQAHYQQPFDLGDGDVIWASAWADHPRKWAGAKTPDSSMKMDVGVYLDDSWSAVARHLATPGLDIPGLDNGPAVVLFQWPDYNVPRSMREFVGLATWTLEQIQAKRMVETGCFASHGRTGTMLACLLVLKGMEATAAIAQVRREHCDSAVEVASQVEWVHAFDEVVNDRPMPVKVKADTAPSALADEFGRRIPDQQSIALSEEVLNDLDEEEAYDTWLRLNAQGLDDATWCHFEDLPHSLCTCPDKYTGSGIYATLQEEMDLGCVNGPCPMAHICSVGTGDCFLAETREDVIA